MAGGSGVGVCEDPPFLATLDAEAQEWDTPDTTWRAGPTIIVDQEAPDMPQAPAGWYADPEGSGRLRWWSGSSWSSTFAPSVPAPMPAPPGRTARIAVGSVAGVLGLIGIASSGIGGLLIMVGLVGMAVGMTAAVKGTAKSFRIRSRRGALGALAASFAIVVIGGP